MAALLAACAGSTTAGPLALTFLRSDGNRLLEGTGPGTDARIVDVALPGRPAWVVATPLGAGARWLVVLEDGRVARVAVGPDGGVGPARLGPDRLPAGAPPAALLRRGELVLITRTDGASALTHAILDDDERRIDVTASGTVRIDARAVPGVDALPDARVVVDGPRAVVLGEPSDAYRHGVLGDAREAGAALVLDLAGARVTARIAPDGGRVIEGLAPIVADLDGDGTREIVLTESRARDGARLAVYDREGRLAGASAAIGLGHRWRHQIGVATTRPGGPPELVSVRTPHLGGIAEFFRLENGVLVEQARYAGLSSHAIGSRNLDAAALGDWDGDGGAELLAPAIGHGALIVVTRTASGAEELARFDAGGRIVTNIGGASPAAGAFHVGFGTTDGRLRLIGALYSISR